MKVRTKYLLAATVALLLASWAGPVMAQSVYTSYYTPQFYGDYLVFYDEAGAPIYYENNNAYAVSLRVVVWMQQLAARKVTVRCSVSPCCTVFRSVNTAS